MGVRSRARFTQAGRPHPIARHCARSCRVGSSQPGALGGEGRPLFGATAHTTQPTHRRARLSRCTCTHIIKIRGVGHLAHTSIHERVHTCVHTHLVRNAETPGTAASTSATVTESSCSTDSPSMFHTRTSRFLAAAASRFSTSRALACSGAARSMW